VRVGGVIGLPARIIWGKIQNKKTSLGFFRIMQIGSVGGAIFWGENGCIQTVHQIPFCIVS
jgi:hypothetical protein